MATDRTGTTPIDADQAVADLDSITSDLKTFRSTHLDATSSVHLNYRQAVDRLIADATSLKASLRQGVNLTP